jgi:hypothetical protein
MLLAILISVSLVALTVFIQQQAFRLIFKLAPGVSGPEDATLLAVVPAVFATHIVNVGLYALAFAWMQRHGGLGTIAGEAGTAMMDFVYLSLTSYTTVGFGDVYATGPMRIVAGIASLNGLLLIGWSASFTYTVYRK